MVLVVLSFLMTTVAYGLDFATNTTLRVGYINNYGTINSPVIQGSEGYGYEYLNALMEYTQGQYTLEFVQCTWDTAFEMLDSGEIDLFGPCSYSEEIAENYIYTQHDFGTNSLFLTSTSNETVNTEAYSRLNGSIIGVPDNDYDSTNLRDFLQAYEIDAEIMVIPSTDSALVFDLYDIDYYIVSSLQLTSSSSFNFLAQIDTSPIYWVSTPELQDLVDDIDYAMNELSEREYLYQERLFLEYYDFDISSNNYISTEEFEQLQAQAVYYVGVQNLHSPFSKYGEDGELAGVAVDFLDLLKDYTGMNIEIIEIDDDTPQEQLDLIDFYLFPTQDTEGQTISAPYLEVSLLLIDHSSTIETAETIGVLTYYGIDSLGSDGLIMNRTVVEFDSLADMKAAFDTQEIDSMIVSTASLNYIQGDLEDAKFLTTTLDSEMDLVITYAKGFDESIITILNKVIGNLDSTVLEYSLLNNASAEDSGSFWDIMQDNPLVIFGLVAFILLCIIAAEWSKRRMLDKQINYDSLTGGYSLHKFYGEVAKMRHAHPGREFQLVALDIDNFKYINEIYGFAVGTQVLTQLSQIIDQTMRDGGLFAREHSDRFLIFTETGAPSQQSEHYLRYADEINATLSALLGNSYKFSFSIGIYNVPHEKEELSYMIDCANLAREMGKDTAGTTFFTFSEEISRERAQNNEIVACMEQALIDEEFFLQYQAKIDLATEELSGVEALVRWMRNGKVVPPNNFIPLFEKNGFMKKLDIYVLERVCMFIEENKDKNLPKISVNLSGVTIDSPDCIANISEVLRIHGVVPQQLDIEITETYFTEMDVALDAVAQLDDMGFTISMDDFGAGISSLNRLKNLHIDTLKIDREFIVDYLGNDRGAVILKSVLNMAKGLELETVAEGIETHDQMKHLTQFGCDVGQGYYFSRPIDGKQFLDKYFKGK